jgi:hypothetical protein
VAILATALTGCGSQLPNRVAPGPGVVDDELTFAFPVESTKIFEWARKYDIEVVEFVRTFPVSERRGINYGRGINYNFDGARMSEKDLVADWRLEIADLTGWTEEVWWRSGRSGKYASRTFLSLVDQVFLRGSPQALAQAKAHPPSAP